MSFTDEVTFSKADVYRIRLENSLAASQARVKMLEELRLKERQQAKDLQKELTTQLGALQEAVKELPKLEALLAQKNNALQALSERLRELENELANEQEI